MAIRQLAQEDLLSRSPLTLALSYQSNQKMKKYSTVRGHRQIDEIALKGGDIFNDDTLRITIQISFLCNNDGSQYRKLPS